MEPKHDLEDVQALASDPGIEHWFSYKRAVIKVVEHLELSYEEAKTFMLNELCNLEINNFCERKLIHGDCYDVYGKIINGIPWYIKFSILQDDKGNFLSNISFHPTERQMRTNSETLEAYFEDKND